jgi:phage N-6-adenine-methyltransferase
MIAPALYSSASTDWSTPQWLFNVLHEAFEFDLDVAASRDNAKVPRYYTEEDNGLIQPWAPYNVWCNPPYGRKIGAWVERGFTESNNEATVVMLLPARTCTRWFHEWVYGQATVRFLRGRLKFGTSTNSAPFPSMVVAWGPFRSKLNKVVFPWPR